MLQRILCTTLAIATIAAVAFTPTTAQAQNEPGTAYFGVLGGLNQSTFKGDDVANSSSKSSFTAGALVAYNVNEALAIQLEARYTKMSADNVEADGGPSISDALDYNGVPIEIEYIEVPVLAKLTAPIEAVTARAFAGPALSSRIGATIDGRETQTRLQSNRPAEERFLPVNLSGIIGGELALPLPGRIADEIALDGRYHFGLLGVDGEGFNIKSRAFTGTLSVRFAL